MPPQPTAEGRTITGADQQEELVEVQGTADGAALSAASAADLHVALVDFAPVYVHGLALGLQESGMSCSVVRSVTALPALLEVSGTLVAVLPHQDAGQIIDLDLPRDAALRRVHVLSEGSGQAWSDALAAGATGAFELSAELEQVVLAVHCAAAGFCLMPPLVAAALGRARRGTPPQLEDHERGYLRSLADGGTVADLARLAGYSEREMYRLLSGVYARVGAQNRTEALLLAERFGLLEEETA